MSASTYLAVDLGAESGRVIAGTLRGERLELEEVHRFPNGGVRLQNHLYWDVLRLWSEVKTGLQHAGAQYGAGVRSIGVDTWGVDFGLLDARDNLIGAPYHYRDRHTDGVMEAVFAQVPREDVYAQTGIQFLQFNSLYQLYALAQADDPALANARAFLNMPDLFNFILTGVKANEFTIVSTTQCYNPVEGDWAFELLSALQIPTHLFGPILSPGTALGTLRPSLGEELGLGPVNVIASAGHDTASAVASVPASSDDFIYLSSGTWSLMGVERRQPLINAQTLQANMTNEGGVGGTFRFLKNIVGLWLVQECRRQWAQAAAPLSYTALTAMAALAPPFGALIDPSDPRYLAPEDMPAAIQAYCLETGQKPPREKGEIVRCILESLALEYRWVAEQIDRLVGKSHPVIHIIGGGSQNELLNHFAANATGRRVISGPVEATAIGNILVQAMAMGDISSLAEGREIVRNSFDVKTYSPQERAAWDAAYERFRKLKGGHP